MKTLTMIAALALAVLLTAGSLSAARLNPQPEPPGVHAPNGPAGQSDAQVAAQLAPPAAIGKCKTDATLRERCTTMWNSCVTAKSGAAPVCKYDWRACCTNKPVRRF